MKRIILVLTLLVNFNLAAARLVINSGHQAPVEFIETSFEYNSVFSLSSDGTLCIRKNDSNKLSHRFFLSKYKIQDFAVSPANNQLAIVETDETSAYFVTVWNWKLEKEMYRVRLQDMPLEIGFSGKGGLLFISTVSSTPLTVYFARTGRKTNYLQKYTRLSDYLYIGGTETTAMSYSKTGNIDYLDIKTSVVKKRVITETNMTELSVTPDKKYLIGRKGEKILLIDRLSGKISDSMKVPGLINISSDPSSGEITAYINDRYRNLFQVYQTMNGRFFLKESEEILLENEAAVYTGNYRSVIYTDINGTVYEYEKWSRTHNETLTNHILNIHHVTVIDDTTCITTEDKMLTFSSPFFEKKSKSVLMLRDLELKSWELPVNNPLGMTSYNGDILLWKEGIYLLDKQTGKVKFQKEFDSEITDLKVRESRILLLEKNGKITIVDIENQKTLFEFNSPGFNTVSFYDDNTIIGGKGASFRDSALMTIDLNTEETLPVKSSMDIVFNIFTDKEHKTLYTVGLKRDGSKDSTVLSEINIETGEERKIIETAVEDTNSNYIFGDSSTMYTNLGSKSISRIKGNRVSGFQNTINKPLSFSYKNNSILSVNENYSLTLWNPVTGRKLLDFYLFDDSEWIALTNGNRTYFGSENSRKYITRN